MKNVSDNISTISHHSICLLMIMSLMSHVSKMSDHLAHEQANTIESFKACYKREFLRTPNELYRVDNGGNMHQTRLRLGSVI